MGISAPEVLIPSELLRGPVGSGYSCRRDNRHPDLKFRLDGVRPGYRPRYGRPAQRCYCLSQCRRIADRYPGYRLQLHDPMLRRRDGQWGPLACSNAVSSRCF